ncbi:MAG: Fe-S cluster assembly ATPase SufC [Patescibacteria group bacterium]
MPLLEIRNLHAGILDKEILQGVNLTVNAGEIHAIMGPNGSGKSSLAYTLLGHPGYLVTGGKVLLNGKNILKMSPDERAKAGLFLAFQYPVEIAGVSLWNLLRTAYSAVHGPVSFSDLKTKVNERSAELKMDPAFLTRSVNEGFSGGEKKKAEILQLAVLQPLVAVLDETDSGLDIDALRDVAEGINLLLKSRPNLSIILITHYFRILKYIRPGKVHVFGEGKIIRSDGPELATELEEKGYGWTNVFNR